MKNADDCALPTGLAKFLAYLAGKNRSAATIAAYATDLMQFFTYLTENDLTVATLADISRQHINEYLDLHQYAESRIGGRHRHHQREQP